jgi:hypothetical protein
LPPIGSLSLARINFAADNFIFDSATDGFAAITDHFITASSSAGYNFAAVYLKSMEKLQLYRRVDVASSLNNAGSPHRVVGENYRGVLDALRKSYGGKRVV